MSFGYTITGLAGVALAAQLAIIAILPGPKPIQVNNLTYENGQIFQDRTVYTSADFFYAQWRAEIIDATTRMPVDGCTGAGAWNYKPGRIVIEMSLARWVGSDSCVLPAGSYRPVAAWFWGDDQEVHRGEVFTIEEVLE